MANDAEKKKEKLAREIREKYYLYMLYLYGVYFLLRVVWWWSSFTFWTLCGLFVFTIINFICYSLIVETSKLGTPFSHYQDILWINWAVMGLSIFIGTYAGLLYCSIPAYLLYNYGPKLWAAYRVARPPQPVEEEAGAGSGKAPKGWRQRAGDGQARVKHSRSRN